MTQNLANPFDSDPGSPAAPFHGVIQTVIIPLAGNAAASTAAAFEGPQLPINYPGDPDNVFDPAEHALPGFGKLRACHDISEFRLHRSQQPESWTTAWPTSAAMWWRPTADTCW